MYRKRISFISGATKTILLAIFLSFLFTSANIVLAQVNPSSNTPDAGKITVESEYPNSRLAPGEVLMISVKLANFGNDKKIDVGVNYKISDSKGNIVFEQSETVAVETTASFVKKIQLPENLAAGTYIVESSLDYPYQNGPAVSKFLLIVENKYVGFFKSDLIFVSVLSFLVAVAVMILFFLFNNRFTRRPFETHDYSNKPKEEMIYYEILGNIISQMRLRVGDEAIEIARNIPDLEINEKNGKVINIKKDPAKLIASLVSSYEKFYGKKISFGIGKK